MVVGVVIINDNVFAGTAADRTGPMMLEYLVTQGYQTYFKLIPAEAGIISEVITAFSLNPEIEVIVTCGGVGIGRREVTPEVTKKLLDQDLPGVAELIRHALGGSEPEGYCTRGTAGIVKDTFLINFPGSHMEALKALKIVEPVLEVVTKQIVDTKQGLFLSKLD